MMTSCLSCVPPVIGSDCDGSHGDRVPGKETLSWFAIAVGIASSLGGIFIGYNQGATASALAMDSFLLDFCVDYGKNSLRSCRAQPDVLPRNWVTFTSLYCVIYCVGGVFGALFGGPVADRCGRRVATGAGGLLFGVGTLSLVLSPSQWHVMVLIGRAIQGVGAGISSMAIPVFGVEIAPTKYRGFLSGLMPMAIATGLLLANIVSIIADRLDLSWRVVEAVALVPALVVVVSTLWLPESPRWLYKHKGRDAAARVVRRLRRSSEVVQVLCAIRDEVDQQRGDNSSSRSLWTDLSCISSSHHRYLICMMLQLLQQATGISVVFTYDKDIFGDVIGGSAWPLLVLVILNFFFNIAAVLCVDLLGRRRLLLTGAAGMLLGHLFAGLAFTAGCHGWTPSSDCSVAAGSVIFMSAALFVLTFAISWGQVCWIYSAEVIPFHGRANAVALSVMTNWTASAVMFVVPKLLPILNVNGLFFVLAALCASGGAFAFYWCPETNGVELHEMDSLFEKRADEKPIQENDTDIDAGVVEPTSPLYQETKSPILPEKKLP